MNRSFVSELQMNSFNVQGLYVDNKEVFDQLASNGASCWDEGTVARLID